MPSSVPKICAVQVLKTEITGASIPVKGKSPGTEHPGDFSVYFFLQSVLDNGIMIVVLYAMYDKTLDTIKKGIDTAWSN